MIYKLYAIVDTVAEEFGPPFQAKNDGVALRNYSRFLKDTKTSPEEHELWYLCDYDSQTGILSDRLRQSHLDCQYDIGRKLRTETEPHE